MHRRPALSRLRERPVELAEEFGPYQHMAWQELRAHALKPSRWGLSELRAAASSTFQRFCRVTITSPFLLFPKCPSS